MSREFEHFLQFNESLIEKAKTMKWIETNFNKIKKDGALCKTMLVIAIFGKSTRLDVAHALNLDQSTVSIYLKNLIDKNILNTKIKKGRKIEYFPKFENDLKEDSF